MIVSLLTEAMAGAPTMGRLLLGAPWPFVFVSRINFNFMFLYIYICSIIVTCPVKCMQLYFFPTWKVRNLPLIGKSSEPILCRFILCKCDASKHLFSSNSYQSFSLLALLETFSSITLRKEKRPSSHQFVVMNRTFV
jgi:hypothetical protein